MTIEIKITGEKADDINAALRSLLVPNAATMPLDDLMTITKVRFNAAGFGVAVTQPNPPLELEDKPTPAEAEAVVEKIEKKLAKKTSAKKPEAADPAAETDKTYVVEEMLKRFADPRQKLKAKAFIDRVTGRHGGIRLSLLDPELFPDIRAEMVMEFNIPALAGNGNGTGAAHA